MTLTSPGIDYEGIANAIVSLLRTNMSDLNDGLDSRFQFTKNAQIDIGNAGQPIPYSNLPSVLVDWMDKDEEFTNLGEAGRKFPIIRYSLVLITRNSSNRKSASIERMRLVKNVEGIFRNNISIDDNVLICNPSFAGAGIYNIDQETYVNVVAVNLNCQVCIE